MAGILIEQRPCGDVHGESGVIGFGDSLVGDEEVTGHFTFLELVGGADGRGDEGEGEEGEDERGEGDGGLFEHEEIVDDDCCESTGFQGMWLLWRVGLGVVGEGQIAGLYYFRIVLCIMGLRVRLDWTCRD